MDSKKVSQNLPKSIKQKEQSEFYSLYKNQDVIKSNPPTIKFSEMNVTKNNKSST